MVDYQIQFPTATAPAVPAEVDPEYIDRVAEVMRRRGIIIVKLANIEITLGPAPDEPVPIRDPFKFHDPPEVASESLPGAKFRLKRFA